MEPALGLLLERLLWPVPRIRWESARSLAYLIRSDENCAIDGLLQWISQREIESEVLLGLGVIHAFDLGKHFSREKVDESIRKPSLLSDWMLQINFHKSEHNHVFQYEISPSQSVEVSKAKVAMFERYIMTAVPPAFLSKLKQLERDTNLAFVDRWQHDWAWLHTVMTIKKPEANFFLGLDQQKMGELHFRLGESMVSAYLRTLVYAMHMGHLSVDDAKFHSMLALPFNRGLADVEPVNPPIWSQNLLNRWKNSGRDFVRKLWTDAEKSGCSAEEKLGTLKVFEANDTSFVKINVDIVVGVGEFTRRESRTEPVEYIWMTTSEPGAMAGAISLQGDWVEIADKPTKLSCRVVPMHMGRVDRKIASEVKLACLGLESRRSTVKCKKDGVVLESGGKFLSRWFHWYVEWDAMNHKELHSDVCSMTTIRQDRLEELTTSTIGLHIVPLASVRVGTREDIYHGYQVDEHKFWLL